jgi:dUTP pyrophosphatase
MKIKLKKLHKDAIIPKYQHTTDAGFDLHTIEAFTLQPSEIRLIPTGLAMAIPEGYELQIRPRSGISLKTKLRVANSPGTVDASYRGEIMVIMENIDSVFPAHITKGDRIAQGILNKINQAVFEEVDDLDETDRGSGGFGSTGSN